MVGGQPTSHASGRHRMWAADIARGRLTSRMVVCEVVNFSLF